MRKKNIKPKTNIKSKKNIKSKSELIKQLPENTSKAVDEVIKYVNDHPDEASGILQTILKTKGIPDDVFRDASIEMSRDKIIPNEAIVKAVKESDVSDNMITGILNKGQFGTETTGQLISQINDEKVRHQNILRALSGIYCRCDWYPSDELLLKALRNIGINGKNLERNERKKQSTDVDLWLRKIISKKMAINYSRYRYSKVFVFSDYFSPEQMIEMDFSKDVINEYEKLKTDGNEIEESDVTNGILEAVATNVAKNYQETGRYIIPQIKNLNNITEEEEKNFIHNIGLKSKRKLNEPEINDINNQILGKVRNTKKDEMIFNEFLSSGIIDLMEGLSDEDRNGTIKVIKESLARSILKRQEQEKVENHESDRKVENKHDMR